ncbi:MAG: redox-regulated ATPase YchF [Candidatus Brocadiae bacterium]|nr:redox-regulated ATPase YchF [Candidatus Brocadiia bacterium]
MKIGIFGLPLSGKTTVFQALSGFKMESANKAKTKEPNLAVVKVPDPRLENLFQYYEPLKRVYATIEYLDMGEAQNQKGDRVINESFLGNLRTVDALLHLVRVFPSNEVPHLRGSIDPLRDIQEIDAELILSDLSIVENSLDRIERALKADKKPDNLMKKDVLLKCKQALEEGKPVRVLSFNKTEEEALRNYQFLTLKPMIVVLNAGEGQETISFLPKIQNMYANIPLTLVTSICGKVEMEISQLPKEEQKDFLDAMNLTEPAMTRIIRESFSLVGLIVFFTTGKDEVRAWMLPKDTKAVKAAGAIHTDLEKGFIRAEVFHYEDLVEAQGSEAKLKETGKIRLEGKEYTVKDGDILTIRFNVKK